MQCSDADSEKETALEDAPEWESIYHTRNLPLLIVIGGIDFIVSALPALVAPFFPTYAQTAFQATSGEIATVFTVFPITVMLCSPLASILCLHLSHLQVLVLSQVLTAVSTIGFGFAPNFWICLLTRSCQGVGVSISLVLAMSLAQARFRTSKMMAQAMGFLESLVGLGLATGPMLGSILSFYLDYATIFLVLGILPLLLLIPMSSVVQMVVHQETSSCPKREEREEQLDWPQHCASARDIVCNRQVRAILAAATISMASFGIVDPLLEIYLHQLLGLGDRETGLFFTVLATVYTCVCPCVAYVIQSLEYVRTIQLGLALLGGSCLLFASPVILRPSSTVVLWSSQLCACAVFGAGAAMAFIPCLPFLQATFPKTKSAMSSNYIMGALNCASYFGESIGPAIGSCFMHVLPVFHVRAQDVEQEMHVLDHTTAFPATMIGFSLILLAEFLYLTFKWNPMPN